MTFYFYDLETSGISPRRDRVMQFAGQRTDLDLNPVGEPDNIIIKLTPDILPQPDAILITGITPQQTLADGITEAEFLKYFTGNIALPNTIFAGFNNIRFDDEFMRFMMWRNFYDAYEWQWKDGRSRWDLLDLTRMTRALRPAGIKWPFAPDGKPSNRLELLASINKLDHVNAHDALSDVVAAIDVARLIKTKQPQLFDYLLNLRTKDKAAALVDSGSKFIYTSGRYPSDYLKTTVAAKVADLPDKSARLVYDLRVDPSPLALATPEALAAAWQARGDEAEYFPVKKIALNRCPALATFNVLDTASAQRLKIDTAGINENFKKLNSLKDFGKKLARANQIVSDGWQAQLIADPALADEQLYDGFIDNDDKSKTATIRNASAQQLASLEIDFMDTRLTHMLPRYKARNYPSSLTADEQEEWEKYRFNKLTIGEGNSALSRYFKRLNELGARPGISDGERYLLEELNLYGQSILPYS